MGGGFLGLGGGNLHFTDLLDDVEMGHVFVRSIALHIVIQRRCLDSCQIFCQILPPHVF